MAAGLSPVPETRQAGPAVRQLALFASGFSGAVFALHYQLWPLLAMAVLLFIFCAKEHRVQRTALLLAGVLLAALWVTGYDAVFRAPARALEGQTAQLCATVERLPRATKRGVSVVVRVQPEEGVPFLAALYAEPEYAHLRLGDTLAFTAQCKSSEIMRDEQLDAYTSKGQYLLLYARDTMDVTRAQRVPPRLWPAQWAEQMKQRMAVLFPPAVAPLVTAIVTGDRAGIPWAFSQQLNDAGLAHTVAVSGLHISFLVGLMVLLLGRNRRRTAAIGIPILLIFMLVAGCTPSVVRAVIMQIFLLLAPLFGRETDVATSLSCALMLLLLQNPYAAGSVSLQLSFASVVGIAAFTGRIRDRGARLLAFRKAKNWWQRGFQGAAKFVLASLATTLGAIALTTPLVAFYFGTVSLVAPLSNLVSLWAVSLTFMGGLLSAALSFLLLPVGQILEVGTQVPAQFLLWDVPLLAKLPFAALALTSVYYRLQFAFTYLVLLVFLAWRGPRRGIVPACCCAVTLCCAMLLTRMTYGGGELTVTMLDVGQGQSILLRAGEQTALVDCGGNAQDNAGDTAANYLRDRGMAQLDLLILTHYHDDHANGVAELLERVQVGTLLAPDAEAGDPLRAEILNLAREKGIEVRLISADQRATFGTAELTVYAPLGAGTSNELGISVLCQTDDFAALFTGDMDGAVEKRLVKYGDLPKLSLLAAGHHGARSSTSSELLAETQPEMVAVSSGYNSYGHPTPEMLSRVAATGAEIYRTDMMGDITVTVRGPRAAHAPP